ncbi:MAG: redoxin family protein [Planctomycetota bacterium]
MHPRQFIALTALGLALTAAASIAPGLHRASLLGPTVASAQTSSENAALGEPAPPLTSVTWLSGNAARAYEPGTVYVLDFWATWCVPCIASMPHLQQLQQKHADDNVEFIGLAVFPRPGTTPVLDFVHNPARYSGGRVQEVTWTVGEDRGRVTERAYMTSQGLGGIPMVMIIDREGLLAWIGHPNAMDEPLAQIVSGEFDTRAYAAVHRLTTELRAQARSNDWAGAVQTIDAMIDADPNQVDVYGSVRYTLTRDQLGDAEGAAAYGQMLLTDLAKDRATPLRELAWAIVNPDAQLARKSRDVELAERAGERAVELTERKSGMALGVLARVRAWQGNYAEAVELSEEALEITTDPRERPMIQAGLAEYRAKLGE